MGDEVPKKENRASLDAGYSQDLPKDSSLNTSKYQGIEPGTDAGGSGADVSPSTNPSLHNIDSTPVENVQPKVEDILAEIENREAKQKRMIASGDYAGAAKVGEQIRALDAAWDALSGGPQRMAAAAKPEVLQSEAAPEDRGLPEAKGYIKGYKGDVPKGASRALIDYAGDPLLNFGREADLPPHIRKDIAAANDLIMVSSGKGGRVKVGRVGFNKFLSDLWERNFPRREPGWRNFQDRRSVNQMGEIVAYEAAHALTKAGSGVDWYQGKITEMYGRLAQIYPELAQDGQERFLFSTMLAITSNGQNVVDNMQDACDLYEDIRGKDRLPEDPVTRRLERNAAVRASFKLVNDMLEADPRGWEGLKEFMLSPTTVGELERRFGIKVNGEHADHTVIGAMMLGPKIGSFWGNLNGHYDSVTMDLWFTRSMNRLSGDTTTINPDKLSRDLAALRDLPGVPRAVKADISTYLKDFGKVNPDPWTAVPSDIKEELDDLYTFVKATTKAYAAGGYVNLEATDPQAHALNKAAQKIVKELDGGEDAPDNGAHRKWMRSVMEAAQARLQKAGINITNADLQAVLWFHEKDLYTRFGATSSKGDRADYVDAADISLARARSGNQERGGGLGGPSRVGRPGDAAAAGQPRLAEQPDLFGELAQSEPARGFEFVSPNDADENLTFDEAQAQLGSQKQKDFRAYAAKIDTFFSPGAEATDALGDWADGAEPTTATKHTGDISYGNLRVSTALKSAFGHQKAGIPFKVDPEGEQFLYEFTIPNKTVREAREIVAAAGIEFRTLVEQNGAVTVYVFDSPETTEAAAELRDKIETLVTQNKYDYIYRQGRGEFLGSWTSREEGHAIFREVVGQGIESAGLEGSEGRGDSNRASGLRELAREAGLIQSAEGLTGPEAAAYSALTGEPLQSAPVKSKTNPELAKSPQLVFNDQYGEPSNTNSERRTGQSGDPASSLGVIRGNEGTEPGGAGQGNRGPSLSKRVRALVSEPQPGRDAEALQEERKRVGVSEMKALEKWADKNDRVLNPDMFRHTVMEVRKKLGDGSEHTTVWDRPTDRVIKWTHGDDFGNGAVGQSLNVGDYLQNLKDANDLFGIGNRVEGVVYLDNSFPQVVISQPKFNGRKATLEEIAAYFKSKGFTQSASGAWVRDKNGERVEVWDAVPDNVFVKTLKNGKLKAVPFDVQISRESSASGALQSEPTREPGKLDSRGQEIQGNPYLPQFQPKVFGADERAATQALERVRNTPEFANVASALKEKTYFKETAPETIDKAHQYVASFGGDLAGAFKHADTTPELTNMQSIVARGLILKQVAKAENLARDAATKTTDPSRRADLLTLAGHYHGMVSDFGRFFPPGRGRVSGHGSGDPRRPAFEQQPDCVRLRPGNREELFR